MANLNTRRVLINADDAKTQSAIGSLTSMPISLYRGTEYIIQANVYSNSASTSFLSFNNTAGWELDVGDQYGSNAAPIIIQANTASWNNTASWSEVNVGAGMICVVVNTAGSAVSADLGNSSSKQYTMEIWYQNNLGSDILVVSDGIYIHNSTII